MIVKPAFVKMLALGFVVGLLLVFNCSAQPVPARNDFKMVVQPNGQHVALHVMGDEVFSWLETRKGLVVIHNKQNGSYDYAAIKEVDGMATLQSSGIAVTENDEGIEAQGFTPLKRQDVVNLRKQKMKEREK